MITGFPLDALRGSHAVLSTAHVYVGGRLVVSGLPISEGSITADRTRFVRRTIEATFLADWPVHEADPLNPYSTEVAVFRGVASYGVAPVQIQVGRFRVDTISRDPNRQTTVTIEGSDRCAFLDDARLWSPKTVSGSAHKVISDLVAQALPGRRVTFRTTDRNVPSATYDESRTDAIEAAAVAVGGEFYCDPVGNFVCARAPKVTDAAVWDVDAGAQGVMISAAETLSREEIYNGVIARAESTTTGAVVQAMVTDTDPDSPTRWNGPFGQRPKFYSSPFLTTVAQCRAAALRLIDDELGLQHSVDLVAVANPALEPGDVVNVIYQDGTRQKHLVDVLNIPLGAVASANLSTRASQKVLPS